MKTKRQTLREARRLFRLCMVDGSIDEDRVRRVVHRIIDAGQSGSLKVLSRFYRLVRLYRTARTARIESVTPLSDPVRVRIESDLTRLYGRGLASTYQDNAALIGGVHITVGSDVYDASIRGRLSALETRF